MLTAAETRSGDFIRIRDKICRVLFQELKGTGKFGKTVHLKLKCEEDGHILEQSLRAEDKVEDVPVRQVKMQYLYQEKDAFIFMNNDTFEQVSLPAERVGKSAVFLKTDAEINVLVAGEQLLNVAFPKTVELKVKTAPPGLKGQGDATFKEVELENGLKILAPQFVKEGETVRVDVDELAYVERVTIKSMQHGRAVPPPEA